MITYLAVRPSDLVGFLYAALGFGLSCIGVGAGLVLALTIGDGGYVFGCLGFCVIAVVFFVGAVIRWLRMTVGEFRDMEVDQFVNLRVKTDD